MVEVREDAELLRVGGQCGVRGEVERDRFAGLPVGGDLQDGGAAEATVGDEDLFSKCRGRCGLRFAGVRAGCGRDDFSGYARERTPVFLVLWVEDERDEAGAGGNNGMAKLAGEVVTEGGCAHPGDGKAAGSDDERGSGDGTGRGFDAKSVVGVGDAQDAGRELNAGVGLGAFREQEIEDVVGGAVAEELAEGLLVVGDAVSLDEGDEVARGEAGERGLGEVGVGGEEVFRRGVEVGEVAAAPSGDEDLFAGTVGVVEDEGAAVAAPGLNGAH